jgi:LuxR family maltose regulon positive regulatory protein
VAVAPPDAVPALLLNGLAEIAEVAVVLDGYEVLHVPPAGLAPVVGALAGLLDYLPPSLHLVISGRAAPQGLPLARMRVRDQLSEVTLRDLALTPEETARYAALVGAGDPSPFYARTVGWITGMRLLCAGGDAGVDAYFARHIGRGLSPAMRLFLRQVASLDVLTASSCARVTGRGDAQAVLESLEAQGYFLLSLDDDRRAWRLHPMMRDWVLGGE